jgi:hypothetical protein
MRRDNEYETVVKGNNGGGWRFDGVVLWLWIRQDGDTVKWERVVNVEMIFLYQWRVGIRRSGEGSLRGGTD